MYQLYPYSLLATETKSFFVTGVGTLEHPKDLLGTCVFYISPTDCRSDFVSLSFAELETICEGDMQDISAQHLPRPLLVIKGTTPATVTLEWEWTLLPEQIAGSDIVYTVLILGSKFQSNINSNFW